MVRAKAIPSRGRRPRGPLPHEAAARDPGDSACPSGRLVVELAAVTFERDQVVRRLADGLRLGRRCRVGCPGRLESRGRFRGPARLRGLGRLGCRRRRGCRGPAASLGAPALALDARRLALVRAPCANAPSPPRCALRAASQLSSRCAAARESSLARPPVRSAKRVVKRSSYSSTGIGSSSSRAAANSRVSVVWAESLPDSVSGRPTTTRSTSSSATSSRRRANPRRDRGVGTESSGVASTAVGSLTAQPHRALP